ncbi:terminase small subunit [Novosphingobium sp. NBM11]|uniref:terminase small subunit n=1 Tax=Novosphingobium sp. NBM11 TaxID=2596914 RepID=UPI0018924D63|nr:terminase small subunit [Novosphingobium sp. NBM11]MBF5091295.1 terminase small subunit [Novosphingobium sp. NBM11]
MTLTPKQQRFIEEYLIDLNATQAAIRAGYSAKTAKQQGGRLLTNVDVSSALVAAKTARSERTRVDADWVLQRLELEAEADLADLYDEHGGLKPVHQWPLIWRKGLVAGIDVEEIKIEGIVVGSIRKVKLSERIKRIDLIGRHVSVGAFKDAETSVIVNLPPPPTYNITEK